LDLRRSSWKEVEGYLKSRRDILVPIGALEEHGYHLPLTTDSIIAERVAEEVSKLTGIALAPLVNYGVCRSTVLYPGTASLSIETLQSFLSDLVSSLSRHGFNTFYLLTGHAGDAHVVALEEVARKLKLKKGLDVYLINLYEIDVSDIISTKGDLHAGELETSLMLHLKPELVALEKARGGELKARPGIYEPFTERPTESGVFGRPELASKEKGVRIFERYVSKVSELIRSKLVR
jgi:creatinine amidohydrolase